MARSNFFSENRGRTFPFLEDMQELREVSESSLSAPAIYDMQLLPNDAIVDFNCNLGVRVDYDPDAHAVYLFEVRRQQSNFIFEFRSSSPGLVDKVLLFSRAVISNDWETEYNDSVDVGVEFSLSISECGDDSDWDGYLSTGTMESLSQILTNDGEKLKGDANGAIVEPGLVRSLKGSFIRSLSLANGERTRAENADGCQALAWGFTVQPVYIARECITGHIRFIEGYNNVIDQDVFENAITLGAVPGGGKGDPCEEVKLFSAEAPAAGDSVLTGGPTCNEVIRSINGIGGRVLDVLSGPGVTVTSEPENNRVIVDFDMNNLALCFDEEPFEESLCAEESITDPLCGLAP